jgi:hypothetical protein
MAEKDTTIKKSDSLDLSIASGLQLLEKQNTEADLAASLKEPMKSATGSGQPSPSK